MRSRYGPILGWGRGWVWRYPGGALFVRIFLSVLQCIPVSRRICRLLTPSTSTRRRISVHCSILRYILLFYQDTALLDRYAHPPHFSAALYKMIQLLNVDLAAEYQAIIAYTVYSQVLKGAAYTDIARELELHAGEELQHAIKIAKQIDYLGGMPCVTPKPVK